MARAYIEDNRIELESEWREKELCKEVPGCRWDQNKRLWWVPLSWASCVALRGVFAERLEIDDSLNQWALNELETRITPCMELRHSNERRAVYGSSGITHNEAYSTQEDLALEDLQTVAVDFLATAQRALCGDGMGSGKSVEAVCSVEELANRFGDENVFPCVIVSTKTMLETWVEEVSRWAPHRRVEAVRGPKNKRVKTLESGAHYYIVNWEMLAGHSKLAPYGNTTSTDKDKERKELDALAPKTVVADEAHRAKNPKAKQTRAWWNISWPAFFSFALTGTPVSKTPEDLWSIMHGVCPWEWPSKTAWVDRYGQKQWNMFGGVDVKGLRGDTQDELFKYLDPRFIRRPTSAVIPNIAEKLPPRVIKLEMVPRQEKAYKEMKTEMIAQLDDEQWLISTSPLTKMTRLLQLASAYLEIDGENVKMIEPSCKVDGMMDVIEGLDEDPLVVFAQHKQLIDIAAARLDKENIPYGIITGAVTELDRATYVRRFQDGQLPVMLATVSAGGEGITLTKARHVLFLQRTASLIQNKQAEDRVYRRGQDRPVQPIYFVTAGTVDERMIQLGAERDVTFEQIVRDKETLRKMLS